MANSLVYDKNQHAKELAAAWRDGRFQFVLDTLCGASAAPAAVRCYLAVAVYRELARGEDKREPLSLEKRPSVVFLALLDSESLP